MNNNKQRPLYILESYGEENMGVEQIASVDDPAILKKGVAFNSQKKLIGSFSSVKNQFGCFLNEEKRIVAAPVMIPDVRMFRNWEATDPIELRNQYDGYDVMFKEAEIRKQQENFMRRKIQNQFNDMHTDKIIESFIIETWIIEDPETDKSKIYGIEGLTKGTWFALAKFDDINYWNQEVKKNGKNGFSIQGNFYHIPEQIFDLPIINIEEEFDEEFINLVYQLLK